MKAKNSETSPDSIVLIDSNALLHRAYHAYPSSLATREGQQTNAVYGFTKALLEVISKFEPKYLVCVFDSGKPSFRKEVYEAYKANRKEMDDELREQFPLAREVVKAFNIPVFVEDGLEADDLIGTLVKNKIPQNLQKVIVTGDHDLLQLVDDNEHTVVYMSGSSFSSSKVYDAAAVEERYKFTPAKIIDFKGLTGDPSDNIPGVAGVGKKGATDILQQFANLDEVYGSLEREENIWSEGSFKRSAKKLKEQKEQAYLSRELATIKTDCEVSFELQDAEVEDYSQIEVRDVFNRLQFNSLLNKLPKTRRIISGASSKDENGQAGLFDTGTSAEEPVINNKDSVLKYYEGNPYSVIKERKEAVSIISNILESKPDLVTFDTETDGLDQVDAKVLGLGLGVHGKYTYYTSSAMESEEFAKKLLELIRQESTTWLAHNIKFDWHMLANYFRQFSEIDYELPINYADTKLIIYLLDRGIPTGLKQAAISQLNFSMLDLNLLTGKSGKKVDASELDDEVLGLYCCADCEATFLLYEKLMPELEKDEKLLNLYKQIELPLIPILTAMEREGVELDEEKLAEIRKEAVARVEKIEKRVFDLAGEEFNIGSPKQVGEILFGKLEIDQEAGIRVPKTKSGTFSTNERTLRNFSSNYEIAGLILEFRELKKLISTYIDALPKEVSNSSGMIHTNYKQTVASTGRLASSDPNLQNIPIASDIGRRVRAAISAGKDRQFLAFDYAQQELRLLAHLSGEQKLIDAFSSGEDIHSLTASEILGVELEDVSKDQRRIGKTVNFGVVYGISGFGLADRLKIERKQADEFIAKFFENYPNVRLYFDNLLDEAKQSGELRTILGRKRDASALKSENAQARNAAERELMNFPLQGGAADIMKLAMLEAPSLIAEYHEFEPKLHLQVHDELIFSVPRYLKEGEVKKFATAVQEKMSGVFNLSVPLDVDAEVGQNWYKLEGLLE
ncbi:MAG: DNA polymerase I [Candidatus Dojkabacteria bacterium]